jgi:hypothetical protein
VLARQAKIGQESTGLGNSAIGVLFGLVILTEPDHGNYDKYLVLHQRIYLDLKKETAEVSVESPPLCKAKEFNC